MDVHYGLIGTSELLKEREPEEAILSGDYSTQFSSALKERGEEEA